MENTISVEIPDAVVAEVSARFAQIEAILKPYLIRVTDAEKNGLLKVGDKTVPFIDKVNEYTVSAPEFIPNFMDVPEFKRDRLALANLTLMAKPGEQVASMITDTVALAANDSYSAALLYYNSVKQAAAAGVAKAKPIYEDLAQRFPGKAKPAAPQHPSAK
ncbi:MAG: hypothetical protein JSS79_08565 [Bacteroidetes bacterium]|nr:hypothetical protein [Bacteroidota bacterium]